MFEGNASSIHISLIGRWGHGLRSHRMKHLVFQTKLCKSSLLPHPSPLNGLSAPEPVWVCILGHVTIGLFPAPPSPSQTHESKDRAYSRQEAGACPFALENGCLHVTFGSCAVVVGADALNLGRSRRPVQSPISDSLNMGLKCKKGLGEGKRLYRTGWGAAQFESQ